ncbi:MAG: MBL fold metallo-hydrolase [Woeseiaceae bacterium]|nr:MBL fold metallo-hydrolase [Woeseiaceae bacterium]
MPLLIAACLMLVKAASAHDAAGTVHYLANEGLMAVHGKTRIVFDPLFNEDFGQYRLLPEDLRAALFAGEEPFDGVDAVFISHYHDDHFDPADMLAYLDAQPAVRLFAPRQAVDAMRALAGDRSGPFERVQAIDLAHGDPPVTLAMPGLHIQAVRIPHAGWPERMQDVENLAWRVTFDDGPTVLHLGDADTRDEHFARDAGYWDARRANVAFPPYWYFLSDDGRYVLDERLKPLLAIGIHVPSGVAADPGKRSPSLAGADLFTTPGETRAIPANR